MPDFTIDLTSLAGVDWSWMVLDGNYIAPAGNNLVIPMGVEKWVVQIQSDYIFQLFEASTVTNELEYVKRIPDIAGSFTMPTTALVWLKPLGIADQSSTKRTLEATFIVEDFDIIGLEVKIATLSLTKRTLSFTLSKTKPDLISSISKGTIIMTETRKVFAARLNLALKSIEGDYTIPSLPITAEVELEP